MSYVQVAQGGKISDLMDVEGPRGLLNLAITLKHLTFFNTADGRYYKFQEFGKNDVGSGKFFVNRNTGLKTGYLHHFY